MLLLRINFERGLMSSMAILTGTFNSNGPMSSDLNKLFKSDDAINEIRNAPLRTTHSKLTKKWNVLPIKMKALAYEISACAWRVLSLLSSCVCLRNFSKRFAVFARHAKADAEILHCKMLFADNFLCPSINTYRKDDEGIYLHRSTSSLFRTTGFFNEEGLCRGMSNWFFYLYFKTKPYFPKRQKEQMRMVTQQFANGAPPQAALLHLLKPKIAQTYLSKTLFLNFIENYYLFSICGVNFQEGCSLFAKFLNRLPIGEYTIFSSVHQFNFIKASDCSYIYDPTYGCFLIDNEQSLGVLLSRCLSGHNLSQEIMIDRVVYQSHLSFDVGI